MSTVNAEQLKNDQMRLLNEKEAAKAERDRLASQLQQVTKQAADADKARKRFLEVFNKKFTEFKKVTSLVFGYKIELVGEKGESYRLQPFYEDDKEKYFMLRYDSAQDAVLLAETQYVHVYDAELQVYLQGLNSYPAFFASVLLNHYADQVAEIQQEQGEEERDDDIEIDDG